jgi:hypothetical protein
MSTSGSDGSGNEFLKLVLTRLVLARLVLTLIRLRHCDAETRGRVPQRQTRSASETERPGATDSDTERLGDGATSTTQAA